MGESEVVIFPDGLSNRTHPSIEHQADASIDGDSGKITFDLIVNGLLMDYSMVKSRS